MAHLVTESLSLPQQIHLTTSLFSRPYFFQSHCQSFDAHLAVIDSEAKNNFIKGLIEEKPTIDYVWIGVKTRTSNPSSHASFSNFDKENPIDGCAVMDHAGVWSIRSCEQLRPFVCQMVVI
ncbi:lectin C-type domain protein [Ancylostoma caninum]|uniref:Lectin C-type domain protein n=1 Tax=Ancylostoma caninum TaxID=29170 RepID=A0A368EZU2_ANCCA|nr:lectin C-type domain protein [Ancylostoma caninum]